MLVFSCHVGSWCIQLLVTMAQWFINAPIFGVVTWSVGLFAPPQLFASSDSYLLSRGNASAHEPWCKKCCNNFHGGRYVFFYTIEINVWDGKRAWKRQRRPRCQEEIKLSFGLSSENVQLLKEFWWNQVWGFPAPWKPYFLPLCIQLQVNRYRSLLFHFWIIGIWFCVSSCVVDTSIG